MANLISIDTSSNISYISVLKGKELFTVSNSSENSHNEEIENLVCRAMQNAGIGYEDLDGIVLGAGPGSFTGLRIGAAYAKGLAVGIMKPIYQYSALAASVLKIRKNPDDAILALMEAGRGEYFVSIKAAEPTILNAEGLAEIFKKSSGEWTVIAPEIRLPDLGVSYKQVLFSALSEAILHMHSESNDLNKRAYSLAEIADLSPLYIRQVAAKTLKERGIDC